jgi:tetratricopeptide (TPR) repeat protein
MKKICLILLSILFLGQFKLCYGLDWKRVHEEADKKGLADAWYKLEKGFSSPEEAYLVGLLFLNQRKDQEAQKIFQDMLKKNPRSAEAKWGLAETLRRQSKLDESQKLLEAIIQSMPTFAPAYISLAYIKYTKLDFKGTVELASKVVSQGREAVDLSNYTRGYLLVAGGKGMLASAGGIFAKIGEGTQVFPNLKKAEELQPESPAVLFGLGSFYFLAPGIAGGNMDKAKDYLERAVGSDPFFADAYVRLAQVYRAKGDNQKFEEYLKKALEIDPQNALARDARSKSCKFICVTVKQ